MSEQLPEFVIAQALARATRDVPGIADTYGGRMGEIATYGRGGRVPGVRLRNEHGHTAIEVHVVATYAPGLVLPSLANRLRERIRQQLAELAIDNTGPIHVAFEDLNIETEPQAQEVENQ